MVSVSMVNIGPLSAALPPPVSSSKLNMNSKCRSVLGETEISEAEGVHLRRKTVGVFLGGFKDLSELYVSSLPVVASRAALSLKCA